MNGFPSAVTVFIGREQGASAVEYAILVAAIAAVIVIITVIVGFQVENAFNRLCQLVGGISGGTTC